MGFMNRLKATLFGREDARARAEDEARFHVEMRSEELRARGMDAEGAVLKARSAYGNIVRQQEAAGDADLFVGLEGLMRDVKVAFRRLHCSPFFLASSVVLLALGLGVNATVFSVLDLLFLRNLPYTEAKRLVVLEEIRNGRTSNSNPARLVDWGERVKSLETVASFYSETAILREREGNRAVVVMRMVEDWVGLLKLNLIEGRLLRSDEVRGGRVALLTERARSLGKIGDTLRIGVDAYTVIGIVGNEVALGEDVQVLTPISEALRIGSRKAGFLNVVARLRPGVTMQAAEAEAMSVAEQLGREYAETDRGTSVRIVSAQRAWTAEAREPALWIEAASALLLLITMVNLASLLAARAMERQREDAVRLFLGAGRWHLLRMHLVEAGLLVALGSAAAILVAPWLLAVLQATYKDDFSAIMNAQIDLRVLLYLLCVALLSTLALAGAMSWQASRQTGIQGVGQFRLRNVLIVAQAALGLVLLASSMQLMRDFASLRFAPNGFQEQGFLALRIGFPWDRAGYDLPTAIRRGLEELAALPGVTGVAAVDRLPLEGNSMDGQVFVDGRAEKTRESVGLRMATNGYFALLGIPLLAGELPQDANSVLVNEAFSKRYLDGKGVGRKVSQDGKKWRRVAGVVGNVRTSSTQAGTRPEIFGNESNMFWPKLNFVVRTSQPPGALAPAMRKTWAGISSLASFDGVRTLEGRIDEIVAKPRRQRDVVGIFGLAALTLVVAGVYGIMASEMARRRREMGIRAAIGANRGQLISIALKRAAILTMYACGTGALLVVLLLSRWVDGQAILEGGAAIVVGMLAAALVPAWRMAKLNPILALRHD